MNGTGDRTRIGIVILAMFLAPVLTTPGTAAAHIFIPLWARMGAAPCEPGTGWTVEFFYEIPDENAGNLIAAERWVGERAPTFTFHADYLDWPAGAVSYALDSDFETLGDFLDGHISDISDPDALDLPFDKHFLLRAKGNVNVRMEETNPDYDDLPVVWEDFGLVAFDGGRIRIGMSIFRIILPPEPYGFLTENAIFPAPGAYMIEVSYFQKYEPEGDGDRAGFELLSCHPGGLPLASAELLTCPRGLTPGGLPPEFIYATEDLGEIVPGDYDVDGDIDIEDFIWFQECYTGPEFEGRLEYACEFVDFDQDGDVDLDDYETFAEAWSGPNGC